jgi:hypothetical protein
MHVRYICIYISEASFDIFWKCILMKYVGICESGICLWQSCMVWGPRRGNVDCDGRGIVTQDGSHVRFVISKKKYISCQGDRRKLSPLLGLRIGSVTCRYIYTGATLVENLTRSISICYINFPYFYTFPLLFPPSFPIARVLSNGEPSLTINPLDHGVKYNVTCTWLHTWFGLLIGFIQGL